MLPLVLVFAGCAVADDSFKADDITAGQLPRGPDVNECGDWIAELTKHAESLRSNIAELKATTRIRRSGRRRIELRTLILEKQIDSLAEQFFRTERRLQKLNHDAVRRKPTTNSTTTTIAAPIHNPIETISMETVFQTTTIVSTTALMLGFFGVMITCYIRKRRRTANACGTQATEAIENEVGDIAHDSESIHTYHEIPVRYLDIQAEQSTSTVDIYCSRFESQDPDRDSSYAEFLVQGSFANCQTVSVENYIEEETESNPYNDYQLVMTRGRENVYKTIDPPYNYTYCFIKTGDGRHVALLPTSERIPTSDEEDDTLSQNDASTSYCFVKTGNGWQLALLPTSEPTQISDEENDTPVQNVVNTGYPFDQTVDGRQIVSPSKTVPDYKNKKETIL